MVVVVVARANVCARERERPYFSENRPIMLTVSSITSVQMTSNMLLCAYKQCHSAETALLKVHTDFSSCNIDNGKVTALTTYSHYTLVNVARDIWHTTELVFFIPD